jgi:hypothetical protein
MPEGEKQVLVSDISGKLLSKFKTSETQIEYDMSSYAGGIYVFEISNERGVKQIKIYK